MPGISYYGVDEKSRGESKEFLSCYEKRKSHLFLNKHVLEAYCQDDVTVLGLACRVSRRDFFQIGNIKVFIESLTIASACNKVLRRKFLKPDTG
jgi:hypothetical protein